VRGYVRRFSYARRGLFEVFEVSTALSYMSHFARGFRLELEREGRWWPMAGGDGVIKWCGGVEWVFLDSQCDAWYSYVCCLCAAQREGMGM
jgi:hypothetical protein